MRLLFFTPLLFLTACATPEQIAQQRAMQEQADIETCKSYGLRPGSEAFGYCRLELDLAREQRFDATPLQSKALAEIGFPVDANRLRSNAIGCTGEPHCNFAVADPGMDSANGCASARFSKQ